RSRSSLTSAGSGTRHVSGFFARSDPYHPPDTGPDACSLVLDAGAIAVLSSAVPDPPAHLIPTRFRARSCRLTVVTAAVAGSICEGGRELSVLLSRSFGKHPF